MSPKKPFKLTGLPRYTRQQVALHESVLTYLSAQPLGTSFAADLGATLGRELRCTVALDSPVVVTVPQSELATLLPHAGHFCVVGLGPSAHKVIVDIDASLAFFCIERLLGGAEAEAGRGQVARAPTDMEAGVLSYLVLHALAFVGRGAQSGAALALTLNRVVGTQEALQPYWPEDDCVSVGCRLQVGAMRGAVRLLLPSALIQEHFGAPVASDTPSAFELTQMRKRLGALPERQVSGRVVGAHLSLSSEDMAGLEVGDIIILENHALRAKADVGLSGAVKILVGQGHHGHIAARLFDEAGSARLEIQNIVEQNDTSGGAMSDEPTSDSDNLPETQGLLREVENQVAVELGRIRLNTAQLVRLKAGQVLPLNRGATDPVDLVVGGKLFAKGELLEVDGELGVRLTQLTGDT